MADWFKTNASIVWSWAAIIAVAIVAFFASRGTALAQLGIGLLTAAIALLVAMAVFEVIWQVAVGWLDAADGGGTPKSTPKHRSRGQ